jgi:hypothetical protein
MNVVLHLDQLLLKLRSQVSPKWRQFGFAVRVPVETLNELSSYQEEDRLSEIADYWMKQHQGRLTWREVARIMREIDLNDLAEVILNDSTGKARASFNCACAKDAVKIYGRGWRVQRTSPLPLQEMLNKLKLLSITRPLQN